MSNSLTQNSKLKTQHFYLEVGQHQLHIFGVAFVNDHQSGNPTLTSRGFMLQKVIFERFPASEFAAAGLFKPLSSRLASLELGHGFAYSCSNFDTVYYLTIGSAVTATF